MAHLAHRAAEFGVDVSDVTVGFVAAMEAMLGAIGTCRHGGVTKWPFDCLDCYEDRLLNLQHRQPPRATFRR